MVGASDIDNGLRDVFTKNIQGLLKTIRENGQSVTFSNPPQTETFSLAFTLGARYDILDIRLRLRNRLKKI
jgi:hypothetical protein